jgi:hypothetical protein
MAPGLVGGGDGTAELGCDPLILADVIANEENKLKG